MRPLLGSGNDPSARSREHAIAWQGENLFSIAGGKYTTYRPMAAQAVDLAVKSLGGTVRRCQTATTPLPRYRPSPEGDRLSDVPDVHASDVQYACRAEMALTVADVMRRRTPLALSRHGGAQVAGQVAGIMGAIHGWDRQEQADRVTAYLEARTRGTL